MQTPQNILDHLADCADVCGEEFPGKLYRRSLHGAHGRSVTLDLIIVGDDGETYQLMASKLPKEAADAALKEAHHP